MPQNGENSYGFTATQQKNERDVGSKSRLLFGRQGS
jgi:hypothetical protein